tara:strand:- start:208 stop:963 length:756 start_codon:yes stop_codon:yes gene_type:complete
MDYILIIPSHRRPHILLEKTWALLQRTAPNIKPIIWLNDSEDFLEYEPLFPTAEFRIGGSGIGDKRNMIQNSYPLNTKIVMIDDDIKEIVVLDGKNKKRKLKDLDALIKLGFSYCEKESSSFWSVYPVDNALFLNNVVRRNLCYCIGAFFGVINKRVPVELDCAEDFERSIKFWELEKKVLRLEFIGLSTKYYSNVGGLSLLRKEDRNNIDKKKLVELYPSLAKLIVKRNITEIKLLSKKDVFEIDIPSEL